MIQKKIYLRLVRITLFLAVMSFGVYLILSNLQDNIVFFYPPSDIEKFSHNNHKIRVGGLVKSGTIQHEADRISFTITDNIQDLVIIYTGLVPALFREGQGIVAEGFFEQDKQIFRATSLLTKHDENYYPKKNYNNKISK